MNYFNTIVVLVMALGLWRYIRVARKSEKTSNQIVGYFLGGRNVNNHLFESATWGSTFTFYNGIYFAVYMGYVYGLYGVLIQLGWVVGYLVLIRAIPSMIAPTGKYTLHGFICSDSMLGAERAKWSRMIAAFVSISSCLLLVGCETYFFSKFLATTLNKAELIIVVSVLTALFAATYCNIGGYTANAATDEKQNKFGLALLTIVILVSLITFSTEYRALAFSSAGFSGSFSLGAKMPAAGMMIAYFCLAAPFYQLVDMTTWQNISAHGIRDGDSDGITKLKRSLLKSCGWILLAPIVPFTLFGAALKLSGSKLGEADLMLSVSGLLDGITGDSVLGQLVKALLLGILCFGFLGAAMSGIDSWLIASAQSLSWDIRDHARLSSIDWDLKRLPEHAHEMITRNAKRNLWIMATVAALSVWAFDTYLWKDRVFDFGFFVFGLCTSMLPLMVLSLINSKNERIRHCKALTAASIPFGYLCSVATFSAATIGKIDGLMYLCSVAAILGAGAVILTSVLIGQITEKKIANT